MSYIDSFDHEFVGFFAYLPIYHPLQAFEGDGRGAEDFGGNPENLILGGGSGEHPGLVLHRLESMVATFLSDQLSQEDEIEIGEDAMEWLDELAWPDYQEVLEFCGWQAEDMYRLVEYSEGKRFDLSVENWILCGLGEFVFFSMPEVNPVHDQLSQAVASIEIVNKWNAVHLPPPGYPRIYGRKVVDGKLVHGIYRFEPDP